MMKLIACLIVLSLFFAFWSSGFIGSTVSEAPKGHTVLEQPFDRLRTLLQSDRSPVAGRWTWDVWAEWIWPPRRRGRGWRKLSRLLRKLRRWYRWYGQRLQQWHLLRQEWRELMDGTLPVKPPAKEAQPSTLRQAQDTAPEQGACWRAAPQVSNQEAPSAITVQDTAERTPQPALRQAQDTAQRGPGHPRTMSGRPITCVVPMKVALPTASWDPMLITILWDGAPTLQSTGKSGRCICARYVTSPFLKRLVLPSSALRRR